MLRLTIIESPSEETPEIDTWTVGPTGASLGRVKENTWTLPDSQSMLSRTHCEVLFEGGSYVLLDTSTNGTFLDDSNEPIGRGQKSPLMDGSTIHMGGYILQVSLETASSAFKGERPSFLEEPQQEHQAEPECLADLDPPPHASADRSSVPGSEVFEDIKAEPLGPDPFRSAPNRDSLPLPRTAGGPGAHQSASPPGGTGFVSTRERGDNLLEGNQSGISDYIPPVFFPEQSDSITGEHAASSSSAEPGFTPRETPERANPTDSQLQSSASSGAGIIPDDWFQNPDDAKTPSMPEPTPIPVEPPPPSAPEPQDVQKEHKVAQTQDDIEPQKSPQDPDLDASLRQALSIALGAHADSLSTQDLIRVVEELATLVEKSTPALMRALATRTQFKDSLRLNQTMVRARDNNPLKPDVHLSPTEALQHILLNDHPGFLHGRLAVEEAFRELEAHQTALIAALGPALWDTIARLSPEKIQAMSSTEVAGGFSLPKGKGKLWDAYLVIYAKMAESERGNLEQKFMSALAEHYEASLRTKG
jgi:type VI secretion system protein